VIQAFRGTQNWKNQEKYVDKINEKMKKKWNKPLFCVIVSLQTKQNQKRSCSMYILTQAVLLKNSKDNIFQVQDAKLEKQYLSVGYKRYERSYKIKEQYKEYTVICPEFRNDTEGAEPIVIIPEFIVPGRPYAVYVYLYAIDLYSSDPEKSQRRVAEETRKLFGLLTFAHTTLGRALKSFIRIIEKYAKISNEAKAVTAGDEEAKTSEFPTVQATERLREKATIYLRRISVQVGLQQVISASCEMSVKWYMKYCHFLL
jgi:hypothetical protein